MRLVVWRNRFCAGASALFLCLVSLQSPAASLTSGTITEIVNDVKVVSMPSREASGAKLNALFNSPDLIRTGPSSRAELTAADKTITRVGANTVFAFEPKGRDIRLEQGSLLFHSPSGKGGGTIKSGGASAAVLGTTIMVSATPIPANGKAHGFKVILLEGKGRVTLGNGVFVTLRAGQMVFVLPGATKFGPVLDINLGKLIAGSNLVNGFKNRLASITLIEEAIRRQNLELQNGRAEDTGMDPEQFVVLEIIPLGVSGGFDPVNFHLGGNQGQAPAKRPSGNQGKAPPIIIRVGP